jgi:Mn2+/Fe2+ NRAMP family transporter
MLAMSLTDLRIAYWMSAILAMMFMSLGASLLRPRGLTPDGLDVAITISTIYTELLGDWMYPVFMIAVFAAMFSTAYTVMDGFPRAFSTIARDLFPESASLRRPGDPAYWTFMLVIFGFIVITNTLIPNPVLLVSLTGLLSLLVSPVLYVLNYYCVTRLIDDPALRPSMTNRIWGILGVVTMSASVVFFLYSQYVG